MSEFTTKNPNAQTNRLPAGLLPGDFNTELFGVKETRKVYGICNGNTIPFKNLNPILKVRIFENLLKDEKALSDLKNYDHETALEEYAFCLYGAADHEPDFTTTGQPGKPENFVCGDHCKCLLWKTKQIKINGNTLTPRQVQIANHLVSDKPDKMIASDLHITESTLDGHKRAIYEKAGVMSKAGFAINAINQNIIA